MKKLMNIILISFLMFVVMSFRGQVFAVVNGLNLSITPSPVNLAIGASSTMNVKLSVPSGIPSGVSGFQIFVSYDKTKLSINASSLTVNSPFSGWTQLKKEIDAVNGVIKVSFFDITGNSNYSTAGNPTLFTFQITGVANGSSNLTFTQDPTNGAATGVSLSAATGNQLDQKTNGSVTVGTIPTNTPIPTSTPTPTWTPTPTPTNTPAPVATNTPIPTATPTQGSDGTGGLVGHWKFDETSWNGTASEVKDSSGQNNHGTSSGGMTTAVGVLGRAGVFDGVDDLVTIVDKGTLYDFLPGKALSVSLWIKFNSAEMNNGIIGKLKDNGVDESWFISEDNLVAGKVEGCGGGLQCATSTSAVNNNQWHHLVLVANTDPTVTDPPVNKQALWVDNVKQTDVDALTATGDTNGILRIGRIFCQADCSVDRDFWKGLIDDVRIYNKALSAQEISALFSSASTGTTTATLDFKFRYQGVTVQRPTQQAKVTFVGTSGNLIERNVTVTSNAQGVYSGMVDALSPGTYDVYIKSGAFLRKKMETVTLQAGNNTKDWSLNQSQQLRVGDISNDNFITTEDIALILSAYTDFSVPVASLPSALYDVNFNGSLTIEDIALSLLNLLDLVVPGDTY